MLRTSNASPSLLVFVCVCRDPKATVLKSEEISNQTAPLVVSFSSRGPSTIVSDILKVMILLLFISLFCF